MCIYNQWIIQPKVTLLFVVIYFECTCMLQGNDRYMIRVYNCLLLSGDGKCVICDSYVRPCTLVRICDECNYGSYQGRCVICGGPGVSDAYYCKECTIMEKDVSAFIYSVDCIKRLIQRQSCLLIELQLFIWSSMQWKLKIILQCCYPFIPFL